MTLDTSSLSVALLAKNVLTRLKRLPDWLFIDHVRLTRILVLSIGVAAGAAAVATMLYSKPQNAELTVPERVPDISPRNIEEIRTWVLQQQTVQNQGLDLPIRAYFVTPSDAP